ncbi:hypothetical protein SLA2020_335090 [Shorea laevis]
MFQQRKWREMRFATERFRSWKRRGFGVGLKPSMEGIQGEFQMLIAVPEEMDQHAPFSTRSLHLKIPFQSQEAEEEREELRRSKF